MTPRPGLPMPGFLLLAVTACTLATQVVAQDDRPAPLREVPSVRALAPRPAARLLALGRQGLQGDPALAFASFRALLAQSESQPELGLEARLGLGRSWLMIGEADLAGRYAAEILRDEPACADARALQVRAYLRRGDFAGALDLAEEAVALLGTGSEELRAAHASALFRNRRLDEAEAVYRRLLRSDPLHVEALVRLGSGLLPPRPAVMHPQLEEAVALQRQGALDLACGRLRDLLGSDPDHPTALRLLGELQLCRERERAPLVTNGMLEAMWKGLVPRAHLPLGLERIFPAYSALDAARQQMVVWSASPFRRYLVRVAEVGGVHDLLMECERTTDAPTRAWLRGKRTFDGRVWDDVRGIGGLSAATGVEALDDARLGGFQTLMHELAHQVHLYALPDAQKARITELYELARRERRTLDYYAESNEAEYFAQGVEAYFSYVKAAGQPVTHGHTHFELRRRDPQLYAFIRSLVEDDPMEDGRRTTLLPRLLDAAIRVGRADDARTVLDMMPPPLRTLERQQSVARAENRYRSL